MNNDYFEQIATKSVIYYENNYMCPQFGKPPTKESVIDCSGYFYAYAMKLIQNNFKKKRDESGQSLSRLLTAIEESLTQSVKSEIISDYNKVFMSLLDRFKMGIDYGEDSMEGFKIMLDSSAKIITCSVYWLEHK
jgi:hypothetical protein